MSHSNLPRFFCRLGRIEPPFAVLCNLLNEFSSLIMEGALDQKESQNDSYLEEPRTSIPTSTNGFSIPLPGTSAIDGTSFNISTSELPSKLNEDHPLTLKTPNTDHRKRRRHRNVRSFMVVSIKDPNGRNGASSNQHPKHLSNRNDDPSDRRARSGSIGHLDDDDDWLYHQQHHMAYVTPDFNHWLHLTMALLLCTCMAILSAYDAEIHCLQHEIYAVMQLVNDDDASIQAAYEAAYNTAVDNETLKCIYMFERVVLPACGTTAFLAFFAATIIFTYNYFSKKRGRKGQIGGYMNEDSANSDNARVTKVESDSQSSASAAVIAAALGPTKAMAPHQWGTVVPVTVSLFCLYILMLVLQIFNISSVMLRPRSDDDINDEDEVSNPYQSLAAVDRYGHVGDNANLYYLSWLSFGLAVALVYQVSTACFRVIRAAKLQRRQERQPDGLCKRSYNPSAYVKKNTRHDDHVDRLLRATSWDCETPEHHRRHRKRLLVDQSRAAWYSSLYRLRVRTGVWTATCITCLIIVASSQYIWLQVLWPYISLTQQRQQSHQNSNYYSNQQSSNLQNQNSPLSYFSVCHQTPYYHSYSSSSSMTSFTPQLCRRTLAAWFIGLVAAVLCAAAIAMHLTSRYFNTNHSGSYRLPAKVVQAVTAPPSTSRSGDDLETACSAIKGSFSAPTSDYYDHDVVQLLTAEDLCPQTSNAWKNATPSALLSRYYSHHHPNRLPLRTELALGILLSLVLGVNAVLVTGVEGPALKVGNLYYASWISFLLCVRICLGCIEEYFNVDEEDDEEEELQDTPQSSDIVSTDDAFPNVCQSDKKTSVPYEAPIPLVDDTTDIPNRQDALILPTGSGTSAASKEIATVSADSTSSAAKKQEKKRLDRVRNYFFLSIFSAVCFASSYDAASNQQNALTREQMYMMYAPCVVASLSCLLFGLSLSKKCYSIVSKFWIGGLLSILSFSILLADLLITMHSDDSWAVNNIGEISMANLYYFAWASIFTSGVQMSSFVKALFGIRKLDYMSAVWVAICKVCFIILGASLHIWHTISDNCEFDEITLGAATFCSRTVLAISVSLTGMLVGGLVVLGRIFILLCPRCRAARFQAHIEMLISLFLVFLFVAAVALITGIGGPGQSVGDLYYGTWGAFWVSIGIFVSCHHQLTEEEKEVFRIPPTA
jgi:hypothetical protein